MSKHIRDKVAEKLVEGKSVGEAAEELGVHRNSVSYHKKALTSDMSESVQEYRAQQIIELSELKAQLANDKIKPEKRIELALSIIDREIDLTGTKAPTKSISARFSATEDPLYLEFKRATMGLDEAEVRQALEHLAKLPRTSSERNEDWFPKNAKEDQR